MIKKILSSLIFQLLLAVVAGLVIGSFADASVMKIALAVKQVGGQVIFFLVPLIIFGFVSLSIARLNSNASKVLLFTFALAYVSSIGAAFFGMAVGYEFLPQLSITSQLQNLRELPELPFTLKIPPVMDVMTALVLSIFVGLSAAWVKSKEIVNLLDSFQQMVILLVQRILLPVLPFFIAANFSVLSYEGAITTQLPVFAAVILIAIACHYVWLFVLYTAASLYARKNGWDVLKHYGPAYVTALGTMSSAATLGVALQCVRKNSIVRKEISDFSIPLFANIHLCGSVLTEVFLVMTVSQILYGTLPDLSSMILFILLLGIFAIGAPGVPGGTVLASLGIVISVLGFDEAGTALLITIFALQDSFGTACNITGDGALALIVNRFVKGEAPDNVSSI
ncbi:MAG: dicarboxylate/amino acid:cation symporter [Bacteroides graminisolvens]|nr:dicarboxylate/amino acid:cation symporter [Bacteroides graminisolvens]MDD3209898.1 dicarboxylate/amino acid:cation symporter [Bacteroides graminisolvens]